MTFNFVEITVACYSITPGDNLDRELTSRNSTMLLCRIFYVSNKSISLRYKLYTNSINTSVSFDDTVTPLCHSWTVSITCWINIMSTSSYVVFKSTWSITTPLCIWVGTSHSPITVNLWVCVHSWWKYRSSHKWVMLVVVCFSYTNCHIMLW